MALNVVYDSGASGVPADVWGSWLLTSPLTPNPREVCVSIVPLTAPSSNWNLAGYACLRSLDGTGFFVARQTPIPLLSVEGALVWAVLDWDGTMRSGTALTQVYGVYWNINRWVGQSRVRVGVRTT